MPSIKKKKRRHLTPSCYRDRVHWPMFRHLCYNQVCVRVFVCVRVILKKLQSQIIIKRTWKLSYAKIANVGYVVSIMN